MNRRHLTVAVVGATGVVGRTMIQVLNEREFPVGELRLLASERSAGRTLVDRRPDARDPARRPRTRSKASTSRSSRRAPARRARSRRAAARGATVIDNSSAWRDGARHPAGRHQVNPDDLEGHEGIIANPNCSTMQLVPVLMALRDTVGLERVVVDTYQSVSGTGAEALAELEAQIRAHVAGEPKQASVYPHPIAFNALPEIDVFLDERLHEGGVEGRHREPQDPRTCPTCASRARPSASRSSAPTRRRSTSRRASRSPRSGRASCSPRLPGVVVRDDPPTHRLPARHATPPAATRSSSGRVRQDPSIPDGRGLAFWVVSDNLRKGAATNAVQLAEAAPAARLGQRARRAARASAQAGWPRAPRDASRAPRGARGHRRRGPGVHPMPASRGAGRRPSRARATRTPRSCSSARARASTRTARAGRSSAAPAACSCELLGSIGWRRERRVHHERREVPPARQPRPGT